MMKIPCLLGPHPKYRDRLEGDPEEILEFIEEISGDTYEEKLEFWKYSQELRDDIYDKLDSIKFERELADRIDLDYPLAIVFSEGSIEKDFPSKEEIEEKYEEYQKERNESDKEAEVIYRKWERRRDLERRANLLCQASGKIKLQAKEREKKKVINHLEKGKEEDDIDAPDIVIEFAKREYEEK